MKLKPCPPWEVKKLARNVHQIKFFLTSRTVDEFEPRVLLRSDAHHDNTECDQEMELRHLKWAKECGAPIIDGGDAFCAMGGKWDRRKNLDHVRPEHQCEDYLDALVRTYADFLEPYAKNFAVLRTGNHETSIRRIHQTCLTGRLCERLRTMTEAPMFEGSYTGWIFVTLVRNVKGRKVTKKGGKTRGHPVQATMKIWHTHGYGGAAPVTKGVIQTNRRAVYTPDANMVLSGHTHQAFELPLQRMRVTKSGRVYQDEQLHVSLPSYKDAFGDGYSYGNWEIEKGFPPAPKGAAWLNLRYTPEEQVGFKVERIQ